MGLAGDSQYSSLLIKYQKTQLKSIDFPPKQHPSLQVLHAVGVCRKYVQQEMSEVAHVSWTSSFQACWYIKKTWKKSHVLPSAWHSETQLWSSVQASLILSSNSLVRVFPTALTSTAWRQGGLSMLWDGWAFGPYHSNSSACLLVPGGEVPVFRGIQ